MPAAPRRCPNCGSDELILHGAISRAAEQDVKDGTPMRKRKARTAQEIVWTRISCVRCGAHCERADQRILELQQQIDQLQFQLALITGRLVPENRLPC